MPTQFKQIYLNASGVWLPGRPVLCANIDTRVAPISRFSRRIKKSLIDASDLKPRHYAFDQNGNCSHSPSNMAANAIDHCLDSSSISLDKVSLLCVASNEVDFGAVSFSNLIQNEMGAQGMQTVLTQGGCIAGVTAIEFAAQALELGAHEYAVVVAVDVPSRHFNRARNHVRDSTDKNCASAVQAHFEDHYTRWLRSDGAGAFLLGRRPQAKEGVSLKLNWIHQKSFAGDFSLNLQSIEGICAETADLSDETRKQAQAAALALRTSSRLIPHLIDICIEEYRQLMESDWLQPAQLGQFLCHYSSEKFIPMIETGFNRAKLPIPSEDWFKPFNKVDGRGSMHSESLIAHTGAATIFMLLSELIQNKKLRSGERILCMVPDIANMSVAFMQLEIDSYQNNTSTS